MIRFHFTFTSVDPDLHHATKDDVGALVREANGFDSLNYYDHPDTMTAYLNEREYVITATDQPNVLAVHTDVTYTIPDELTASLHDGLLLALGAVTPDSIVVRGGDPEVEHLEDPAPYVCSKCGEPVPEPTPEMRKLAAQAGVPLSIDHAVCPGDEAPPRRQFAVVVTVHEAADGEPNPATEPFFRFQHVVEADDLEGAMRPLAEGLGSKWMAAEKQARIADDGGL